MEKAIEQTKLMIASYYKHPDLSKRDVVNYNPFYWFTNENIKAYLEPISFRDNQKALTVLASGDQAFNLIAKGVKNIDTFDINKLTEYYVLGLKIAMILKYNYNEFLVIYSKIFNSLTSPEEIVTIVNDLLPYMDGKYRKYWREIIGFYAKLEQEFGLKRHFFWMFKRDTVFIHQIIPTNIYLENEIAYNKFKANLVEANITFKHANVTELADKFNGRYDYLLLSNIFDYIYKSWGEGWPLERLNSFLETLKPILNTDSTIFLHYCFNDWEPLRNAKVKMSDFSKEDVLKFNGMYDSKKFMILKRIIN